MLAVPASVAQGFPGQLPGAGSPAERGPGRPEGLRYSANTGELLDYR